VSALGTIAAVPATMGRAIGGRGGGFDRWLSRGRRRPVVTALLAVLIVAVLALGTVLFLDVQRQRETDQARSDGLRAAAQLTTTLLSYDYRTLDADLAHANSVTTGDFTQQYGNLAAQLIRPNAGTQQIVTKAEVVGSSVVTATPNGLVALLYINQSTTGKQPDVPQIDRSRAKVTLTFTDGKWLISDLVPV
jgi:Mce-associated membrane protein